MSRPKKMDNCVRLSVALSEKQAERIKYMAIRMSSMEGRQITVSEAIRRAIGAAYPMPKNQIDLFS